MTMSVVIDFQRERAHREADQAALLATFDPLDCPKCGRTCAPMAAPSDRTVTYECPGPDHRLFAWRIDANGDMLQGRHGNRFYKI